MDKSPLAKRQKLTGTSYDDVNVVLESVVNLRKNAALGIQAIHSFEISDRLKELSKIEVNLSRIETCELPDMDPTFQGFRKLSREYDELTQRICNHIPLLTIMEKKKKCPTSKIIDEI